MAEKEERIAIVKWNTKDSVCPAPTELQCGGAKSCNDCKVGMSRQEAINRMAKAICKETNYQCSVCEVGNNKEKCEEWIVFQYKTQAEAALNALLGESND